MYMYIYLYMYRNSERREKVASSVWGYVFSILRTLRHGFKDMLHSPWLPTVQHHNSNNTPTQHPTYNQQATSKPCVHEYMCVFVCRLLPERCASISRVVCGLSCSWLSWLGSVKRESEEWRCHMTSGDIWQSTQKGQGGGWLGGGFRQAGVEESRNRTRVTVRRVVGVESHQLSGFSCVSMSTRQIGHFLLVASHWSTQPWWKRCMQGNLLEDTEKGGTRSMLIYLSARLFLCICACNF